MLLGGSPEEEFAVCSVGSWGFVCVSSLLVLGVQDCRWCESKSVDHVEWTPISKMLARLPYILIEVSYFL